MDGKRINITDLNLLLYGEFDPEFPSGKSKLQAWKIAEACIKIKSKDIKLYRDGSRWGVSFYDKPQIGYPIVFGTGGYDRTNKDLENLFYNPQNYNIIPFNNVWDADTARSRNNKTEDSR